MIPDLPRSCQNDKTAKSGPVCEPQYGRAVAQPRKINTMQFVVLSAMRKNSGFATCLETYKTAKEQHGKKSIGKKDMGRTAKELKRNNMGKKEQDRK